MFVCSRIILLESLTLDVSLHRLWISLLIKFSSKTIKQNTTKNKFIRYLCFITVDFFHSCHHRLKMSCLVWRKTDFGQSIWPAGNQCNHCFYDSKLPWTRVLKEFLAQEWQQSLWKFSILSNIPDLEWYLVIRWKIHSPTVCHVYLPRWQRWQA